MASDAPISKFKLILIGLGALIGALFLYSQIPYSYEYKPTLNPAELSFEQFHQKKLEQSRAAHTRPNNEERLVQYGPPGTKTEYAFLFIHGFGASRAEGEAVMDVLSAEMKANLYYMRLPGHGTNTMDHASTTYRDYLNGVEEALSMMPKLGEKIIVVGASTGGLLATYLAANHPDKVHALIVTSPFYGFAAASTSILNIPGGLHIVHLVFGEDRDASWSVDKDPEAARKQPGYENFWLTQQKFVAIDNLNDLRRYIAHDGTWRRVTAPALMLYYYQDEKNKDQVIDLKYVLDAFSKFGTAKKADPLNRAAAIADANHIMLSKYVKTDKERILSEMRAFLKRVRERDHAGASDGSQK